MGSALALADQNDAFPRPGVRPRDLNGTARVLRAHHPACPCGPVPRRDTSFCVDYLGVRAPSSGKRPNGRDPSHAPGRGLVHSGRPQNLSETYCRSKKKNPLGTVCHELSNSNGFLNKIVAFECCFLSYRITRFVHIRRYTQVCAICYSRGLFDDPLVFLPRTYHCLLCASLRCFPFGGSNMSATTAQLYGSPPRHCFA